MNFNKIKANIEFTDRDEMKIDLNDNGTHEILIPDEYDLQEAIAWLAKLPNEPVEIELNNDAWSIGVFHTNDTEILLMHKSYHTFVYENDEPSPDPSKLKIIHVEESRDYFEEPVTGEFFLYQSQNRNSNEIDEIADEID